MPDKRTAFSQRDTAFEYVGAARWTDPAEDDARIAAARASAPRLEPFASGVYVNVLGDDGAAGVRRAYPPAKLARLTALKDAYDPRQRLPPQPEHPADRFYAAVLRPERVTRLHADEVVIDDDLVRRLLADQLPELAGLLLRRLANQGTDNVVYRLGSELSIRLPRKVGAVGSLLVEREWLPRLAPRLPVAVPTPVAAGEPTAEFPHPWLVCRWVVGEPPPPAGLGEAATRDLAQFVRDLQGIDPDGAPQVELGRRAGPMAAYDPVAERALRDVAQAVAEGRIDPGLVDLPRADTIWAEAVATEPWPGLGVWIHRDLMASNLLTNGDHLAGVLDFGGLAVGDPAGDVMAAFHAVRAEHRALYRELVGADEGTWTRARGWALVQALEALPYYLDTHPGMVAMATYVLGAVQDDHGGRPPA